jgi:hypothetical protein
MERALVTHHTIGQIRQALCALVIMILQAEDSGMNSPSDFRYRQLLLELEREVLISFRS